MIEEFGIIAALEEVKADTGQTVLDTTELLIRAAAALAALPQAGRAASDAVWDAAARALIDKIRLVTVQTNYIDTAALSVGSGEDVRYVDVAINAVSAVASCDVSFAGGAAATTLIAMTLSANDGTRTLQVTARLMNPATLRLSCVDAVTRIVGRWKVVDHRATV